MPATRLLNKVAKLLELTKVKTESKMWICLNLDADLFPWLSTNQQVSDHRWSLPEHIIFLLEWKSKLMTHLSIYLIDSDRNKHKTLIRYQQ